MEHPPSTASSAPAEAIRAWDRPLVVLPILALIAAIGGAFGSFTSESYLLVLAVGGTFAWIGVTGRAGRRPSPARLGRAAAWWLLPLLLTALVELNSFTRHSTAAYPTLSLLADPILEHYLPKAAFYFAWLWGFWGLARR
jgi:hypothetical protein